MSMSYTIMTIQELKKNEIGVILKKVEDYSDTNIDDVVIESFLRVCR